MYMGCIKRENNFHDSVCVITTCKKVLKSSDKLKDEVYLQIIKQMTDCSGKPLARAWELMNIYVGIFMPSSSFYPYMRTWLFYAAHSKSAKTDTARSAQEWAAMAYTRFVRTSVNGERITVPLIMEMSSLRHNNTKLSIQVHYGGPSPLIVPIDSATISSEVIKTVISRLRISKLAWLSLVAMYPVQGDPSKLLEVMLPSRMHILDMMSRSVNAHDGQSNVVFSLCKRYYVRANEDEETNEIGRTVMYNDVCDIFDRY